MLKTIKYSSAALIKNVKRNIHYKPCVSIANNNNNNNLMINNNNNKIINSYEFINVRTYAATAKNTGKKKAADGSRKIDEKAQKKMNADAKAALKMFIGFGDGSAGLPSLTPEEKEELSELAKKYNVETSKRHHAEMKDIQLKIDLLHEALDALPMEEQEFARTHDNSPVPMHRPMIVDNPPVKDYDVKKSRD